MLILEPAKRNATISSPFHNSDVNLLLHQKLCNYQTVLDQGFYLLNIHRPKSGYFHQHNIQLSQLDLDV
ncbi:hypothetical protein A4A49_50903 [Nicotiana attenuata]|uniref:Uncharacterized protein n=1 Tax=Nicotiana attenuata TaxID=49451 RepID=A0A1J6IYU9_NICAT|nr:hypothetical protein A4A49_50903 [Nicotiana attenuata]